MDNASPTSGRPTLGDGPDAAERYRSDVEAYMGRSAGGEWKWAGAELLRMEPRAAYRQIEVARLLGLSGSTVGKLIKEGKLAASKISGDTVVVTASSLERMLGQPLTLVSGPTAPGNGRQIAYSQVDAARLIGVSDMTLRRWAHDGNLLVTRIGNTKLIPASEVERLRTGPGKPRKRMLNSRPETGPMSFGEDWPGVFIRRDTAAILAQQLAAVTGEPAPDAGPDSLEGLVLLLRSASRTAASQAVQ